MSHDIFQHTDYKLLHIRKYLCRLDFITIKEVGAITHSKSKRHAIALSIILPTVNLVEAATEPLVVMYDEAELVLDVQ